MSSDPTRLVFARTGKPAEVLAFEKAPLPSGEVVVRILAAPLNPADLNTIEGRYGVTLDLPATPGIEGCGVVESSASAEFKEGDRVIFLKRSATWASHVAVTADTLLKVPAQIDPLQAAMLKVNPATAWQLLHGIVKLQKGDWVVLNAGNSAVGRCVIQLARDLGVRTIAFVRRPELLDPQRELGSDCVLLDEANSVDEAKQVMAGANAALAFNAVGGESALRLMKLLREGGTHITYGGMARKPVIVPNGLLIFRGIKVCGLWITKWIENAALEEVRVMYADLAERVVGGRLLQAVDSTFSLENFQAALARLEAPDRDGKVLFVP